MVSMRSSVSTPPTLSAKKNKVIGGINMRWLINYIRSCFCNHDFELLKEVSMFESEYSRIPMGTKWVYRCKKCGYHKVVKDY